MLFASKENVILVTIYNIPQKKIFEIFNKISAGNINVDMISQTPSHGLLVDFSFTIDEENMVDVLNILGSFKKQIKQLQTNVNTNNAKLVFYDENMVNTPGVAASIFSVLSDNDICIKMITTSEKDISILVASQDFENAYALFN